MDLKVDATKFKPGGCAEFLYRQITVSSRSYEEKNVFIKKLKTWYDEAKKQGFNELAERLYSYYSSQQEALQSEQEEAKKELALVNQAEIIDGTEKSLEAT